MELNKETIDAHFELMTNPKKHKLPWRPLEECFEPSGTITAQHVLFNDYLEECPAVPKVFFYIVMEKVYGPARYKDDQGNLGFNLKFKQADEK